MRTIFERGWGPSFRPMGHPRLGQFDFSWLTDLIPTVIKGGLAVYQSQQAAQVAKKEQQVAQAQAQAAQAQTQAVQAQAQAALVPPAILGINSTVFFLGVAGAGVLVTAAILLRPK